MQVLLGMIVMVVFLKAYSVLGRWFRTEINRLRDAGRQRTANGLFVAVVATNILVVALSSDKLFALASIALFTFSYYWGDERQRERTV